MTLLEFIVVVALLLALGLGAGVYWTNPRRNANQAFLVGSIVIATWLLTNFLILQATNDHQAAWLIRTASATGSMIPTFFYLLRTAVLHPDERLGQIFGRIRVLLAVTAGIFAMCYLPPFLVDARVPPYHERHFAVAEPTYGPLFPVYIVFFLLSVGGLIRGILRDRRKLSGIQRAEVEYILFGAVAALLTATLLGMVVELIVGTARSVPVANAASVIVLTTILSYGIATRRILGFAEVVQHLLSYALVGGYLALLYAVIGGGLWMAGRMRGEDWGAAAHLVATAVVALSISPAASRIQPLVVRLTQGESALLRARRMREAGRTLISVRMLDGLYREFAGLVADMLDVDRLSILVCESGQLRPVHGTRDRPVDELVPADAPWLGILNSSTPVPRYALERTRPTPNSKAMLDYMRRTDTAVAASVLGSKGIEALVLLGSRRAGHHFGSRELVCIETLCGQFAFALANARLYTEVEDAKLYNEILLENLSSGVVACDAERRITLLNREAARILKAPAADLAGRGIDALPPGLAEPLDQALAAGRGVRELDVVLSDGEIRHLRLSSSVFTGLEGRRLGALLVINDVTTLRRMEESMRRADRLASVGTLAAGMAHEIKNPLVSIKTFVQVLPRAFDDPEVRSTFCPLIESEVSRIDMVVNRLLNFARPAKAALQPMQMHAVLVHTLRLVEPRLRSKGIALETAFEAPEDQIEGDASLLEQVFINLYFNAVDAMSSGGRLRVETSVAQVETGERDLWGAPARVRRLRVSVRDTGHGIRAEDLPRVFDPFYTTKSEGSGLGLAIAYGIIQEHRGSFDVESRMGEGTVFHVAFPLASPPAGVEVAL